MLNASILIISQNTVEGLEAQLPFLEATPLLPGPVHQSGAGSPFFAFDNNYTVLRFQGLQYEASVVLTPEILT